MKKRRFWFWGVYGTLLAVFTLAGLEILSGLIVPPWPARELRPVEVSPVAIESALSGAPALPKYNSWGVRDREHPLQKPVGAFRTILVGDSFAEGAFVEKSIGMRMEELWQSEGRHDLEVMNLGIAATGPPQYFYRIRNIALSLQPDALVLMFYSGNDFVANPPSFWRVPPLIAERPQPSWLGTVAPRLTWLLVNRLGLSEFGGGNVVGFEEVRSIIKKPRAERIDAMVRIIKNYYYPDKDEGVIREILSRGGDSFWEPFEQNDRDREYLQGWWIAGMVDWETGAWSVPLTLQEIEQSINTSQIDSTMSWLLDARELARESGIKFLVALVPVGVVDPRYAEFWSPWPRYLSYPNHRAAMHRVLRNALEAKGVAVVDLEDDLKGRRGTYRLSDGHWTELGTEIAARRIAGELERLHEAP